MEKKISREDLVGKIAESFNGSRIQARHAVDAVLDGIRDILSPDCGSHVKLSLPNFGSFVVTVAPAHQAKDPRTGERFLAPERRKVLFRPALTMKKFIAGGDIK